VKCRVTAGLNDKGRYADLSVLYIATICIDPIVISKVVNFSWTQVFGIKLDNYYLISFRV